jgi:hypothetical protein
MATDEAAKAQRGRTQAAQAEEDAAPAAEIEEQAPASLRVTMSVAEQEALRRRLREKFH